LAKQRFGEHPERSFDRMNRMNRIRKAKAGNRSKKTPDLSQKLAGKCFHPVNPVHPVQSVFLFAALPGCGLFRLPPALLPGGRLSRPSLCPWCLR
jgi:hypothetical protein